MLFGKKMKIQIDIHNQTFIENGIEPLDYEKEKSILEPIINEIRPLITDTTLYLNKAVKEDKNILFEGAQGMWLDIDFGTYPYVTSSNTTIGGVCSGSGIPPQAVDSCIGIVKAYTTRVGEGPFMTELHDELGEQLRKVGHEFGATTGRPRRCGWFDAVATRYSAMVNGVNSLAIMKLDVLSNIKSLKICIAYEYEGKTYDEIPDNLALLEKVIPVYEEHPGWEEDLTEIQSYDDLPKNAKTYIARLEELSGMKASLISVGPRRAQTFQR